MKRRIALTLLITYGLLLAAPVIAHEAKKYLLTIGGKSVVIESDEAVKLEPLGHPEPPPVDPPPPPPIDPPPPPVDHDHGDHAVMVMPDRVMMGNESVPRFGVGAESVAVKSGNWSDASTWTKPPAAGDAVQIPEGLTVTYDVASNAEFDCIEVSGCLDFSDKVATELWATEIMVMPSGCLCVEPGDCSAEIVFPDGPLRTSDVGQSGRGLIAFGEVRIEGRPLTKTFTRLVGDAKAGDTKLTLREAVDWPVGSEVVLPDTRHVVPFDRAPYWTYVPQWEVRTVVAVDGDTITLDAPLAYDHVGPRDMDGTPTIGIDGQLLTPHVACLSRSVVFRSENPEGVRGHVQLIADAQVSIRHAEFRELGRTRPGTLDPVLNHIGRYSLHCHHLVGRQGGVQPGAQFVLEGNSIRGGLKWGIVIHESHFGLIKDNVVYDIDGSCIVTERGNEVGNAFEGNFACRANGREHTAQDKNPGDFGNCYWITNPLNTFRNNVACNCYRAGFEWTPETINPDVVSPVSPLGPTRSYNLHSEAVQNAEGNEAYGAMLIGFNVWEFGDQTRYPAAKVNTLTNSTVWHVSGQGVVYYNCDTLDLDGWLHRGDANQIGKSVAFGISGLSEAEAIMDGGQVTRLAWLKKADVQGNAIGCYIRTRGGAVERSFSNVNLDNPIGIRIDSMAVTPATYVYDGIRFGDSYSPGSLHAISMVWNPPDADSALGPERHTVTNFQQINGLDLEIYYREQARGSKAAFVPEGGIPKGRWAPESCIDGKALGIDGLVVVTAHPEEPLVFANVLLEGDTPTLHYAVIGDDDDDCKVAVSFDGQTTTLSGVTGTMPLTGTDGTHALTVVCDCGASLSKSVKFPVKR